MKTTTKLLVIATTVLFLQSCNMAKHYANKRIGGSEFKEACNSNSQNVEMKSEINASAPEILNEKTPTTDLEVEVRNTNNRVNDTCKSEIVTKPNAIITKHETKSQNSFKKTIILKRIFKFKSKLKIRKPGSAQKEMTFDDWGIVACIITAIAFVVLWIVTGSFIAAVLIAANIFVALLGLIAMGVLLYGIWVILKFLGGGFA